MLKKQVQIAVISGGNGYDWLQLAADSFARMKRLQGMGVHYYADQHEFTQVFKISCDASDDEDGLTQDVIVNLVLRLQQTGQVYKRKTRYPVCNKCGHPQPGSQLCSICGGEVINAEREGYFLRLGKIAPGILGKLSNKALFPPFQQADVINSFSNRTQVDVLLALGVNRDKVYYFATAWLETLALYLKRCGYPEEEGDLTRLWPNTYFFLPRESADNVQYWCAVLSALNLPMPGGFICHSSLRIEDRKGQEVSPMLLAKNYGQEVMRYFILANKIAAGENSFSEDQVIQRVNHDLANELGNLVSRVTSLVFRFSEGMIPAPDILTRQTGDLELRESALETPIRVEGFINTHEYYLAVKSIKNLIGRTNRFIETTAPWQLASDSSHSGRLNTILYSLCEALRFMAVSLKPLLPEAAHTVLYQLGIRDNLELTSWAAIKQWGLIPAGTRIIEHPVLFPRIVPGYGGIGPEQDLILREDLARIKMIVARVVSAEQVEDFEGLLQLILYDGSQRCRVLAPIAYSHKPASLTGKKVVMIANLRPLDVEELHSEGEVLVTEAEPGVLQLIFVNDDIPEGRKVLCLS